MWKVLIFAILCIIYCTNSVSAQTNVEPVTFQQMAYGDWLKYDENGNASGIFHDIMRRISEESGVPIKFSEVPFIRTNRDVTDGKQILTGYMTVSEGHSTLHPGHIIIARLMNPIHFVLAIRPGISAKTYKDMEGYTVSYFRGATPEIGLVDNPKITVVTVDSTDQAVELLIRGRIDAVWADLITIRKTISAKGLKFKTIFQDVIFSHSSDPILVTNQKFSSDYRVKLLVKAATRLQKMGILDQIAEKYLKLEPLKIEYSGYAYGE